MYVIRPIPECADSLDAYKFDPFSIETACPPVNIAAIDKYAWPWYGYEPKSFSMVGWNARGLYVKMWSFEGEIHMKRTAVGSDVCRDSCLEFFLSPVPDKDPRYINIEGNPLATVHIGVGEGREHRKVLNALPGGMTVKAAVYPGKWWALSYNIPLGFIKSEFPDFELSPGKILKGNFYKCGGDGREHYAAWNETLTPKPDFHRPERFADMRLSALEK